MPPVSHCFVCTRCEYPICAREDLLTSVVEKGTTEGSFEYNLEDLLEVEESVPCYSAAEVTEVKVAVSERILSMPLPPAARLLALEAVVESQRNQLGDVSEQQRLLRQQQHQQRLLLQQQLERHLRAETDFGELATSESDAPGGDHRRADTPPDVPPPQPQHDGENGTPAPPITSRLARFGRVAETRVDLVCVRADVTGLGLVVCSRDRGAAVPPVDAAGYSPATQSNNNRGGEGEGRHRVSTPGLPPMPASILEAARQQPPPTQWASHPGNFVVEEAFVQVRRHTKTSQMPWFSAYDCAQRMECPDCHLGLGYLFTRNSSKLFGKCSSDATSAAVVATTVGTKANLTVEDDETSETSESRESVHEPHPKRGRHEETLLTDGQDNGNPQTSSSHPDTFIGLELKKIRECRWGLRDFQQRYHQSQSLKSFRALFPEAEELESLHTRLTALRTQSELYNSLICKHKEQNDVQSALLQSQKDRINTYEEKLRTMQQIIEAQRAQLEMQGRQIKHQLVLGEQIQKERINTYEEKMRTMQQIIEAQRTQIEMQGRQIEHQQLVMSEQSQNERISTCEEKMRTMQQIIEAQRTQIEMLGRQIKHQQLVIGEQSRTISSQREQLEQREQLAQMQARLRACLEMRSGQVNGAPQLSAERRQHEQLPGCEHGMDREDEGVYDERETESASLTNAAGWSASRSPGTLPPKHLMAVTGSSAPSTQERADNGQMHNGSAAEWLVRARESSERTAAIMQRLAEDRLRRQSAAVTNGDSSAKTPKTEHRARPDGDDAGGGNSNNSAGHGSTVQSDSSSVSNSSSE